MFNFYLPIIIRGMSIHHPKAFVKIVKAITTLQEPHNFILTSYHASGGHKVFYELIMNFLALHISLNLSNSQF